MEQNVAGMFIARWHHCKRSGPRDMSDVTFPQKKELIRARKNIQ